MVISIVHEEMYGGAIHLFVDYANDHPKYRRYVIGPCGLSKLVSVLVAFCSVDNPRESWEDVSWASAALLPASDLDWTMGVLLGVEIRDAL